MPFSLTQQTKEQDEDEDEVNNQKGIQESACAQWKEESRKWASLVLFKA